MSCTVFYLKDNKLLDAISSAQKYTKTAEGLLINHRRENKIVFVFKNLYATNIYFVFYIIFIVKFTYHTSRLIGHV